MEAYDYGFITNQVENWMQETYRKDVVELRS